MATLTVNWSAGDQLRAVAITQAVMTQGRRVLADPDAFRLVVELLSRADRLRLMATMPAGAPGLADTPSLVVTPVNAAATAELDALPPQVADAYLATRRVVTSLYRTARRVSPASPVLELPTQPAIAPFGLIALTVLGVAAVAGASWFGVEAVSRKIELDKHRVSVAAQVMTYVEDLQARIATGQPLPDPPDFVARAADSERAGTAILVAAGMLLGGAGVAGAIYATRQAAPVRRVSNPAPRRRSRGRRRRRNPEVTCEPSRAFRGNPAAMKRQDAHNWLLAHGFRPVPGSSRYEREDGAIGRIEDAGGAGDRWHVTIDGRRANPPRARSNPLRGGYSRRTVSDNIAALRTEGMPAPQAAAASLRSARAAYRRTHPRGPWPSHLAPPGKARAAARRGGTPTRARAASGSAKKPGASTNRKPRKRNAPKAPRAVNAAPRSPRPAQPAKRNAKRSKSTAPRRAKRSAAARKNPPAKRALAGKRRAKPTRSPKAARRRKRGKAGRAKSRTR